MRRIDDTFRVLALVVLGVGSGLAVAGFANGSADARDVRTPETSPPMTRAAAPPAVADAPARRVRIVYSGPLVALGGEGDETRLPRAVEIRAAAPETSPAFEEPAVTGSIAPAVPPPPARPVWLAALGGARGDAAAVDPADSSIDLNTASVEDLNALEGGGRIGKAIARGRPYASPEDLLHKRVLNRATYARIRDQVTVR